MTDSPAVIARKQLHALYKSMGPAPTDELRVKVGMLAAQIEIAARLEGIERSLDVGLNVNVNG
jgi:hypothetical protein